MTTFKKSMAFIIATGISVCSFSQVNLGLQQTTQAAMNATLNTAAISKVTTTATQAVQRTVSNAASRVSNIGSNLNATLSGSAATNLSAATSKGSTTINAASSTGAQDANGSVSHATGIKVTSSKDASNGVRTTTVSTQSGTSVQSSR